MKVDLIDSMGTDDRVVDAARVSFAKEASNYTPEQNAKLIRYLSTNGHFTPFTHCTATFRIAAPIFVARQLAKHQVGLSWNEVSRRYVDGPVEFYTPEEWHGRAPNVKQGSDDAPLAHSGWISNRIAAYMNDAIAMYEALLRAGVAPEEARVVLPLATYTEWYWTGSLAAWARVCRQRLDPHAQRQTREIARMIADHCVNIWPVSWAAVVGIGGQDAS